MAPPRALAAGRRFLAHVRFVLGAALVGSAAGLAVALLLLPPVQDGFAASPALSRWVLALTPGVAIGWWIGLLWGAVLSFTGRGTREGSSERQPMTATLLAATVLVLVCGVARVVHLGTPAGLSLGFTAAAAVGWWWAAR